jgi:spermidine synthase
MNRNGRLLIPALATTMFASALLLFWCQPMVGKMVLPLLGGAPAVWTTCVLFFQAVLLAGYVYAHLLDRIVDTRRQVLVHGCLLLLPLAFLPIRFDARPTEEALNNPSSWLLAQLMLSVGLPFFAVSTTAPLMQSWLARTAHASAKDPYFLYSASNAGSLLGLIGYPFLLEPVLGTVSQSNLWVLGYAIFVALVATTAGIGWQMFRQTSRRVDAPGGRELFWKTRLFWAFAAFVPSALMLAVTSHITANLTSAPFIWIVPLAIYLITFIAAFGQRWRISSARVSRLIPVVLLAFFPLVTAGIVAPPGLNWILVGLHLVLFSFGAMLCHAVLAERRPAARNLTEYYFWIALGGVFGGIFTGLLAPAVFSTVLEYPLLVAALAFFRPTSESLRRSDFALPAALALAAVTIGFVFRATTIDSDATAPAMVHTVFVFLCYKLKNHAYRFATALAVLLLAYSFALPAYVEGDNRIHASRNFFGVKKVLDDRETQLRRLLHGDTTHGIEAINEERRGQALSYYHETGPVGDIMRLIDGRSGVQNIGVVGLGSGTMASFGRAHRRITFYEIDPEMRDVAQQFFSFLRACGLNCDVVLGDGRFQLALAPDGHYDLLMLDAFSSDSVPAHLLSGEAIRLYISKLAPDGILLFNVSNRYLNVKDLVAAAVIDAGLVGFYRSDEAGELRSLGNTSSEQVAAARRSGELSHLARLDTWTPVRRPSNFRTWTDDYSNVLSLMRWW